MLFYHYHHLLAFLLVFPSFLFVRFGVKLHEKNKHRRLVNDHEQLQPVSVPARRAFVKCINRLDPANRKLEQLHFCEVGPPPHWHDPEHKRRFFAVHGLFHAKRGDKVMPVHAHVDERVQQGRQVGVAVDVVCDERSSDKGDRRVVVQVQERDLPPGLLQ